MVATTGFGSRAWQMYLVLYYPLWLWKALGTLESTTTDVQQPSYSPTVKCYSSSFCFCFVCLNIPLTYSLLSSSAVAHDLASYRTVLSREYAYLV